MHAQPFAYHRAESVDHAITLLETVSNATPLAGGHGLIPAMKKREQTPDAVVDIGHLDSLCGIDITATTITIGALATHTQVLASDLLQSQVPVVPQTVSNITGGKQVHNFATIGGNLARAHPGYDYEGALLAADATIHVRGSDGDRRVPIATFVRGACQTVLDETELITGIELPAGGDNRGGGYSKKKEPASGNAIVGVATDITFESPQRDRVATARVAVNGIQPSAVRLTAVENELAESECSDETIERAAAVAGDRLDSDDLLDNKKASNEYRHSLLEPEVYKSLLQSVLKPQ